VKPTRKHPMRSGRVRARDRALIEAAIFLLFPDPSPRSVREFYRAPQAGLGDASIRRLVSRGRCREVLAWIERQRAQGAAQS
jgi:Asp/Glu/hydantoin racemase